MTVIYKMEWVRSNPDTLWFEDGFKDGLYKDSFEKLFKDVVAAGKANKMEVSVSEDGMHRYLYIETNTVEDFENLKSYIVKKYPTYLSDTLEYNLSRGIFCVPENCGASINGGPLIFDL